MTVVCNDGTIYCMRKEPGYNSNVLVSFFNMNAKGIQGDYTAIKMVAKHVSKLNIMYRCSKARRGGSIK